MRMLVLAVVALLSGCSWLTARANNNPRVGCSRTSGRIDAGIALVALAGMATTIIASAANPPGEGDHSGQGVKTSILFTTSLAAAILFVVQSSYGLRVADRCQAERAKLTMTTAPGSL